MSQPAFDPSRIDALTGEPALPDAPQAARPGGGLTKTQSRTLEYAIIGLCVVALLLIFQPVALGLYSVGAGLVVLGGLAFNLIPLCRPGERPATLLKAAAVVVVVLLVVALLGFLTAQAYVWYLGTLR